MRHLRVRLFLLVCAPAALAATGCTVVGPRYERPAVDLPDAMPLTAKTQAAAPWTNWWTEFRDSELDRLVSRALAGNLDIRAAAARVRTARVAGQAARLGAEPRLDGSGDYTRQRGSEHAVGGSAAKFSSLGDPDESLSFSAAASWEPDLWGRVRRTVEAAEAVTASHEEDRLAMEVALVADLIEAYLDRAEALGEIAVHEETVAILDRTLELTQSRVDVGVATEADVRRAETDRAQVLARIPDARRRSESAERRIALLCGEMPGAVKLGAGPLTGMREPPQVPVGLPAALLDRRPDLRSIERRIEAANARVGVAIADFYPRVTILGRAGLQSVSPDEILRWGSRTWSFGPGIELPLLDGGRREFEQLRAEAEKDAVTAEWMAAITRAVHEVSDAAASVAARREVRARLGDALQSGKRSVELAEVRYREGLTGSLDVLDSQRSLASTKLDLIRAERDCRSQIVALCRALGGGWTRDESLAPSPGAGNPPRPAAKSDRRAQVPRPEAPKPPLPAPRAADPERGPRNSR